MKTATLCIILCICALILGKRQSSRIADLEKRIAAFKVPVRMEPSRSAYEGNGDYRGKYRQRAASLGAQEVFETVLSLVRNTSVSSGPDVVMENREALQAMLKLDLAGQKELIRLIATSNDPRLGDRRNILRKWEQINVCLCAMSDRHPETALEYLRNSDERIGSFYREWMEPDAMISYTIRRLCEHDPAAGLQELVAEAGRSVHKGVFTATDILVSVAEDEPELALETIPRLPVASRVDPLRIILSKTDSDEQCTRQFQSLRHGLRDDPASLDTAFSILLGNVSKRNNSWRKSAAWIEALNLSNEEKLRVAKGLRGLAEGGVDGHPEPTQWIADYLPPSKERNFILWSNIRHGVWRAMDPQAAEAFLRKNSIDEVEMKRLDDEKFLSGDSH
ncbi:MAG: hypothetical protein MUF13_13725 [Akkermansiaceae bacterium]|jgi:hypothetical protein|nr:hypothetical protein [Akkermansiaceae bacterium]